MSLASLRMAWQVYVIIYRDGGQRSDNFQSGNTGADRTVHNGGRARGGEENPTVSLTSSRMAWQVYVIIHRDGGQRSDNFQSGNTEADRIVHDGGRARGGGSGNEG